PPESPQCQAAACTWGCPRRRAQKFPRRARPPPPFARLRSASPRRRQPLHLWSAVVEPLATAKRRQTVSKNTRRKNILPERRARRCAAAARVGGTSVSGP